MTIFDAKNATRYARVMQFQVQLQKAAEITYLEAKKKQARYCLTYFQVKEFGKKIGWYFQGENTTPKRNVTF